MLVVLAALEPELDPELDPVEVVVAAVDPVSVEVLALCPESVPQTILLLLTQPKVPELHCLVVPSAQVIVFGAPKIGEEVVAGAVVAGADVVVVLVVVVLVAGADVVAGAAVAAGASAQNMLVASSLLMQVQYLNGLRVSPSGQVLEHWYLATSSQTEYPVAL